MCLYVLVARISLDSNQFKKIILKKRFTEKHARLRNGSVEWINGNLGSGLTMLYPCSVLIGENSRSENIGIAFANCHSASPCVGVAHFKVRAIFVGS